MAGAGTVYWWPAIRHRFSASAVPGQPPDVCYSCLWEGYDAKVRDDLIAFYRQFTSNDPISLGDARYVIWRATSIPNCDARTGYRTVAVGDSDPYRRFLAGSILGFGGPECRDASTDALRAAADGAESAGLAAEARLLQQMAEGTAAPRFGDLEIKTSLSVPRSARTMVLGESRIELTPETSVGVQVDRVARDWISAQMKWTPNSRPLGTPLIRYHEGGLVTAILENLNPPVYPLAGALVARKGKQWFGPDETGVFRFPLLDDKLEYPTTHVRGDLGFIEDTHGISVLVPQALERHLSVVIGCGDAEGKAKAAFYLAQKGVHVVFPGDRFQDLLVGYSGSGVLLGGAPLHAEKGKVTLGAQPVRFSLAELIVVEDTKMAFPVQYYDAAARYFRRLAGFVKLNLDFALVDAPGQMDRVLERARSLNASAVGVRVATSAEDEALRAWLKKSPHNRAILFHSGLYPYAQPLFRDFHAQVTFGDLRPRFE